MRLSFLQKQAAREIIAKILARVESDHKTAAITFANLHTGLSSQAQELSHIICDLRPHHYGIRREAVTPKSTDSLVVVENQTYSTANGIHKIPSRLVPRHTFRAFQAMNQQLKKDIGHELVIQSGYRSPAYQLFIFLFQLRANDWDIKKTMQTVSLPAYSEHAGVHQQALDLRAARFLGPHNMYDFSRLPSYRWLLANGHEFGFSLSYPKENNTGTQFEPWHWRHSPSSF